MANRIVRGLEVDNGCALYQLKGGTVIDLGTVVSISGAHPHSGESVVTTTHDTFRVGEHEGVKLFEAWFEYKNNQDYGNHLSYIAHKLEALINATQVYR